VDKWPGKLVVIGDGPDRARLMQLFPSVEFIGERKGDQLAAWYTEADVMFLASKLETFGLVQIEAMACGTPVAALPSAATDFVIDGSLAGIVSDDLYAAGLELAERKLANPKAMVDACVERATIFNWEQVCKIALFASTVAKERASAARRAQLERRNA
ncbi:MAG: glycosyltransferase, partial [Clostridia bacterium]|nr:glycosyltransferase [Deltaproteobacteria bacterium]